MRNNHTWTFCIVSALSSTWVVETIQTVTTDLAIMTQTVSFDTVHTMNVLELDSLTNIQTSTDYGYYKVNNISWEIWSRIPRKTSVTFFIMHPDTLWKIPHRF